MKQNDLNLPWSVEERKVFILDAKQVKFAIMAANNHHRLVEVLKELADSLPFGSQPMRVMNASKKARKLIADCS